MTKIAMLVAGVAAVLGIGLATPVATAHADPGGVTLCQVGGEVPCFCPNGDGGSMRTSPFTYCPSTLYGPWRGPAVAQRDNE
ncbi:hypothetical protein H7J07_06250 [Mycobacterium koreense]|nr:hypothetical protein [Mycolicibacillus koreensis]MCV7247824.1 hypothetical protein [Mycolicibacillus koreensis]BBY54212.1 hypothetical protein MKOR_14630 [Mycolicibacillus koreensis]